MQQTIKRTIAKEIIILFSCIILIGLTWTIFLGANNYNIQKAESLSKEIFFLNQNIDSIQNTFAKAKIFEDFIDKDIRDKYLKEKLDYSDIINLSNETQQTISTYNIEQTIALLHKMNYPTPIRYMTKGGLPVFKNIKEEILLELGKEINQMSELKKIYNFLINQRCIHIEFEVFVFSLQALPLPPPHAVWTNYQTTKKQKEELISKLNNVNSNINSPKHLTEIIKWISIILLSIVYPFRILILILAWAFKTVKQKSE